MAELPIIDSHVHLWDTEAFRYSWLDRWPRLKRPYLPKDFRAASAQAVVEKIIFVEGGTDPGQGLAEAGWVNELAAAEPMIKGIVAQSTLAPQELEKLAKNPLVKGVRQNFSERIDADGMKLLAEWALSCDLLIVHAQLPETINLVARHPGVNFILDHCGKPAILNRVFEPWAGHIKALAALPNVCCKISGLTTEDDHQKWQVSHLQPYIAHVVECFGFDRVLFGSDWPVATLAAEYSRWIETVLAAVGGASQTELRKLFHTNAERIYRV